MASANYLSDVSSSDENEDSTNFEGQEKLDLAHQELDSEMLRFHLEELNQLPDRYTSSQAVGKNKISLRLVLIFAFLGQFPLENNLFS